MVLIQGVVVIEHKHFVNLMFVSIIKGRNKFFNIS